MGFGTVWQPASPSASARHGNKAKRPRAAATTVRTGISGVSGAWHQAVPRGLERRRFRMASQRIAEHLARLRLRTALPQRLDPVGRDVGILSDVVGVFENAGRIVRIAATQPHPAQAVERGRTVGCRQQRLADQLFGARQLFSMIRQGVAQRVQYRRIIGPLGSAAPRRPAPSRGSGPARSSMVARSYSRVG